MPRSEKPTRTKGTAHALFFNTFYKSCFPSGVYWKDVDLTVSDILGNGRFDDVVQVHPVTNVTYGHQGSGVLGYASDGAYINGVVMFSLQLLLFLGSKDGCPTLPEGLKSSLAAVSVKYTRHQSNSKRCASIWKETATKAALNRPLDPFMMVSDLTSDQHTF